MDFQPVFSGTTIGYPAQGSYGYNDSGTQLRGGIIAPVLGLGSFSYGGSRRVSEGMVVTPSDMIVIGDSGGQDRITYRSEGYQAWSRHKRSHNTVFCDGHVEEMKMGANLRTAVGASVVPEDSGPIAC